MPDFAYANSFPDQELGAAFQEVSRRRALELRGQSNQNALDFPSQSWDAWHGLETDESQDTRPEVRQARTPRENALLFFERTGILISPTAIGQHWRNPDTNEVITADEARVLSFTAVQRELGKTAL